jgi:hypothetical protein
VRTRAAALTASLTGLACLALLAAGCGGNGGSGSGRQAVPTTAGGASSTTGGAPTTTSSPGGTSTVGPGRSTTTTRAKPTKTTATTTTTTAPATGRQPAGGPVPGGFDPVSFTAVSDSQFWLLGTAPCTNPVCTSIVRTTDGGAHFVGIPAPTAPLDQGPVAGGPPAGGVNTLRFADPYDGYAFDSNAGGSFWDTHDGGEHWSQPSFLAGRTLIGFGTGGGYAFVLVGSCQNGSCSDVELLRSPVGADQWSKLSAPVPTPLDQGVIAVHGSDVWVSVMKSTDGSQVLLAGTGSGTHFSTYASPCQPTLGTGSLAATSSTVLWAVCPTGMMAEALRSTDGGASWQAIALGQQLTKSALLAPANDTTAVLEPSGQGQLLRTTDGGATWKAVAAPAGNTSFTWLGFTDAATLSGLGPSGAGQGGSNELWRSSDGGTTWSGPIAIK